MESTTRAALAQPSPAEPTARLSPALVHGQKIHLQCPEWCVMDHVAENARFLEDISHVGAMSDLIVPGGDPEVRLLAHACLESDPFAMASQDRGTWVSVDDGAGGFQLTAEQADVFADRLIAFAQQVRALGRSIGEVS